MNNDYTITQANLDEMGIKLADDKMASLLAHLNEELNERVGTALLEELSVEQVDEYNEFSKTASDDQIGEWLSSKIPEFKQIIQDEIDIILGDIAEKADDLSKS